MSNEGLLHKVRSLMAKAEATEFPEEADAFLAKAQALITAHAIDMGDLKVEDRSEIITVKWWVPEPYGIAKSAIAGALQEHVGIFMYRSATAEKNDKGERGRWLTVYGTEEAVAIGETIFTSLLSQCVRKAVKITDPRSTKSARDQYIMGFSLGVKEQLSKVTEDTPGAALALLSEAQRAEAACEVATYNGPKKRASEQGRQDGLNADVNRGRLKGQKALGQ